MTAPSAMTSRHSSETVEHFTPPDIVEAARAALGGIDLDPASCAEANRTVKAHRFFARKENGFRREWHAKTVFLNPPGGLSDDMERVVRPKCHETGSCGLKAGHKGLHENVESNQKKWWFKLTDEWTSGRVRSAIFVMFSVELLQTTQNAPPTAAGPGNMPPLIPLDFAICFPRTRVRYVKPGGEVGTSPPHSSGIVLVSGDANTIDRFDKEFVAFGRVIHGPIAHRAAGLATGL